MIQNKQSQNYSCLSTIDTLQDIIFTLNKKGDSQQLSLATSLFLYF